MSKLLLTLTFGLAVLVLAGCQTTEPSPYGRMPVWDGGP